MKTIKVIYNGKRLRDIYPHATWFQVLKFKVRKFIRKTLILLGAFGMVYLAFFMGKTFYPNTSYAQVEKIITNDSLQAKIEELKWEVVDTIQRCESAGKKEDDGLIIFDSNNRASVGTMQFQIDTVQRYYKLFNSESITRKDAVLLALDDKKAKDLAYQIAFADTSGKGIDNWYNCSKKHNLHAQVAVINKLAN